MGNVTSRTEGTDYFLPKNGATSVSSKPRIFQWPAALLRLYRVYCRTLDIRILLSDGSILSPPQYVFRPVIFAHSERDDLALPGFLNYQSFTVLVATGRDGDWAARALEGSGCTVARGSSLRDGIRGLRKLIQTLRASPRPAAICVDGPLGPPGVVRGGVLTCARQSGRPIIPVGTAARRSLVFRKAWSQIFLPLPFSRVVVCCGDPLEVPTSASPDEITELRAELTRRLAQARHDAEQAVRS